MIQAPSIANSTREERAAYVVFHGKDPMLAFKDYIDGAEEMQTVAERYR